MNQTDPVLIGIDLGTSSVRVMVASPEGQVLALAGREILLQVPLPAWAEQDPAAWLESTLQALGQAVAEAGIAPGQVAGIGFSGQMHGLVCVDSAGQALRPAILWADQRSAPQVQQVLEAIGVSHLAEWTGNPLAAGFQLVSWLWLQQHEPGLARRTAHLLLPKDYLRQSLGGTAGSEPSDASATGMFDSVRRTWSADLLAALAISPHLLPPLYPSAGPAGGLSASAAHRCGLRAGTPLVFGAADQAAQALGNAILAPGLLSCTIGTGGQLLAPLADPAPDPALRLHHYCLAAPTGWYRMAATLSAGLSLRWLRDQVFEGRDYASLADLAASVPDAGGAFFLPHLAGERTPYMDSAARGAFYGLSLTTGRAHLVRAVMEGAVFALRLGLETIQAGGVTPRLVVASGGASRHPLWLRLQADIFGLPVWRTRSSEAGALGAALLAGVGAGIYPDAASAAARAVRWEDRPLEPLPDREEYYQAAFETFKRLYPALQAVRS